MVEEADLAFYKKIAVPLPTFCPDCRFQRRCGHINVRNLYTRNISPTGKVISMYSEDKNLQIIEDKEWWSDKYDPLKYGKEYNYQQSFFEQCHELMQQVPLPHLQRAYSTFENSDYCNAAAGLKNCYLIINADSDENCMYGFNVQECKDCTDISYANKSELCYESVHLLNCYGCSFCNDCEDSNGLQYCQDCVSCTDCFGCIGLRHKSNHIFNQMYSPQEYKKKLADMSLHSWQGQQQSKEEVLRFFLTKPRKFIHGRNNHDIAGDHLYQCKNVTASYLVKKAEDCKFVHFLQYIDSPTQHAYDYTMFGVGAELMYEDAWCGLGCNNVKFSLWNYGSSDIEYCFGCHYSQKLFGCIGLRHKKFCILNKQYSEDEYEETVHKIKEQMMQVPYVDAKGNKYRYGEFFPIELSPFDYNQTLAQDFCPLKKEEAVSQSYGWHEVTEPQKRNALSWKDLPDSIDDVHDDLLTLPILCKAYEENPSKALEHHCTQYFKIIPQELAFYQKVGIALPRNCHNTRHYYRLQQINHFQLWTRQCGKCGKDIQTTYASDRPEIVYCEQCYLQEVY